LFVCPSPIYFFSATLTTFFAAKKCLLESCDHLAFFSFLSTPAVCYLFVDSSFCLVLDYSLWSPNWVFSAGTARSSVFCPQGKLLNSKFLRTEGPMEDQPAPAAREAFPLSWNWIAAPPDFFLFLYSNCLSVGFFSNT